MLFSKKIIGSLNRPKTSAAEAEGRLLKSFGIGRLCSASVIVWLGGPWPPSFCRYIKESRNRKSIRCGPTRFWDLPPPLKPRHQSKTAQKQVQWDLNLLKVSFPILTILTNFHCFIGLKMM